MSAAESKMPARIWTGPEQLASSREWGLFSAEKKPDARIEFIRADTAEQLAEALRIIAGRQQCIDNLMSNADVASAALSSWEAAQ